MSGIDYSKPTAVKDEEHIRYFIKLPVLGWYETDQKIYRETAKAAMSPSAWSRSDEPDGFNSGGLGPDRVEGYRITSSNGKQPPVGYKTMGVADVEDAPAPTLPPRVERTSHSVTLTFPEGSYTDYQDVDGALVVVLSAEEYQALGKAQAPVALENMADRLSKKPVPEDSLREALRDGVVDGLQEIAKGMRTGKKAESPLKGAATKLRAVKDLLK